MSSFLHAKALAFCIALTFVVVSYFAKERVKVAKEDVLKVFVVQPDGEQSSDALDKLSAYGVFGNFLFNQLVERLDGTRVEIERSSGSLDSLVKLHRSENPAVAIAQSDVLWHFLHGGHPQFLEGHSDSQVRAFARLFPEWLMFEEPDVMWSPFSKQGGPLNQVIGWLPKGLRKNVRQCLKKIVAIQRVELRLGILTEAGIFGGRQGSGTLVTSMNVGKILSAYWQDRVHEDGQSGKVLRAQVTSPKSISRAKNEEQVIKSYRFLRSDVAQIVANALPQVYRVVGKEEIAPELDLVGHLRSRNIATISLDAVLVGNALLNRVHAEALIDSLEDLEHYSGSCTVDDCQECHSVLAQDGAKGFRKIDAKWVCRRTDFDRILGNESHGSNEEDTRFDKIPVSLHRVALLEKLDLGAFRGLAYWAIDGNPSFTLAVLVIAICIIPVVLGLILKWFRRFVPKRHQIRLQRSRADWTHRLRRARIASWISGVPRFAIIFFLVSLTFVAAHLVAGAFVWLAEVSSRSLLPQGRIVTEGPWLAPMTLFKSMVSQHPLELRSTWSTLAVGGLQFFYAASSFLTLSIVVKSALEWTRNVVMPGAVVLIGWNSNGPRVLGELEAEAAQEKTPRPFQLLMQTEQPREVESNVRSVACVSELASELENIGASKASAIVILRDENAAEFERFLDADLWVLHVLRVCTQFLDSKKLKEFPGRRKPRTVVELADERNRSIAIECGASEAVAVSPFGVELLAQSAKKPELAKVFEKLLQTESNSGEFYFEPISKLDPSEGEKFKSIAKRCLDRGWSVIGYERSNIGIVLLQGDKLSGSWEEADRLIVVRD